MVHAIYVDMPSILTERIFHCLIFNRPLLHAGCLRRSPTSRTSICRDAAVPSARAGSRPHQCRQFLDMKAFRVGGTKEKALTISGFDEMVDFVKRMRVRARLPTRERIAEALTRFLKDCCQQGRGIEDAQAELALESFKYCMNLRQSATTDQNPTVNNELMMLMAQALDESNQSSQAHVELAKYMYHYDGSISNRAHARILMVYCKMLKQRGAWKEAVHVLTHFEDQKNPSLLQNASLEIQDYYLKAWNYALVGASATKNEADLFKIYGLLMDRKLHENVPVVATILQFYQHTNNVKEMRKWWTRYIILDTARVDKTPISTKESLYGKLGNTKEAPSVSSRHNPKIVANLLKWCTQHEQIDFGNEIVANVLTKNPPLPMWNVIFVWAASTGKGVDEIDRMIDVMERANSQITDHSKWRVADATTINALVEYAMGKRDPYTAERFMSVGHRRGIEPNHRTFAAQISYRLDVDDTDGALAAFRQLQRTHCSNMDLKVLNKLIVSLCKKGRYDFDTMMNIAADLSDRKVLFEAETVVELMKLHLGRDEIYDVVDLLSTHAPRLSSSSRALIVDSMLEFCTSSKISTAPAWETYNVLREFFDEIRREVRTDIMCSFFRRSRPDLAVHVFNHMRNHSRPDTTATADTYITAFGEIAKLEDEESLEVVHNQLRLDFNIEPNTLLRTSLIMAYTACNQPRSALQIWDNILASKEGPSYSSVHAAFRACEHSPFGAKEAHAIWEILQRKKVDIEGSLWTSYLSALAAHGQIDQLVAIVEQAEAHKDLECDAFLLGSLCLVSPSAAKQREIEDWARVRYPKEWNKLAKTAIEGDGSARTKYAIDRDIIL